MELRSKQLSYYYYYFIFFITLNFISRTGKVEKPQTKETRNKNWPLQLQKDKRIIIKQFLPWLSDPLYHQALAKSAEKNNLVELKFDELPLANPQFSTDPSTVQIPFEIAENE